MPLTAKLACSVEVCSHMPSTLPMVEDEKYTETGSFSGFSQSLADVATHEIGHALGLQHSNVEGSVMWPIAKHGEPEIHEDDIKGIRSMVLHVEHSLCLSARSAEMIDAPHCIFGLIELACKLLIAHFFFSLIFFFRIA